VKIRDQFILTTAIFGLVLIVLAASLIITAQRIQRISSQQLIADNLEQDAHDLSFLSNDYLLYQEEQKYNLWESMYLSIYNNLSTLSDGTAEQQQTVNNINTGLQRLKSIFSELNSVMVGSPGNQVNLDFVQISWSRIEVQNQSLISDAERLSRSFRAQIDSLSRNNTFLILTVAAVFGAFLILNYFFTARRVLSSISTVRTGTKIIGAGNLDYVLPDKSRDEIGDLSRAFNQMTTDLKKVTASKTDLEKEIAERKQAEQALIESEERYRGLVELAPEAVIVHREGEILYANASALKLFAAPTFEQLAAHNILEYIDPENREAARQSIRFIAEGKTSSMTERKAYRLDGQPWTMEAAGSPTYWKGQKCIQVIIRDITERKKAEGAIHDLMISVQQEKDRLATLISGIPDEVWFADTNKNFVLMNPRAVADFNLKGVNEIEVETFARNLEVYRPDGSRRGVGESPALRALKGETVTNLEEKVRLPATGEIRDRQVSSAPVRDPQGNIVGGQGYHGT
jgi:PAS domain S-box-containing protein